MPSNNQPVLTIFMLAYENAVCVTKLLDSFASIHKDKVKIVVLDNSDKSESVSTVCNDFQNNSDINIYYTRNICNLGAIGSILKAFEMVDTPYLWVVGACNEFGPNCVDPIISLLENYSPDCMMIFENGLWRTNIINEPRVYSDMNPLLIEHSYSVLCSINSLIYNSSLFKKYLSVGYEACSSLVPHTAMVLEGLRNKEIQVMYAPIHAILRPARPRVWSTRKFLRHITAVFPGHVPEPEQEQFLQLVSQTDQWIHEEIKKISQDNNYGYALKS